MSRHNAPTSTMPGPGFTLVELVIVMTLTLIMATTFYTFFKSNLSGYITLQSDASNFTDAATQAQRVSNVIRGLTGIISASDSDLQIYAYFFPSDTYVSQVHYYLNGSNTQLMADVTPMTANPPSGMPITSEKKTYTIINNFQQSSGVKLFVYLDASNNALATPVADTTAVKAIQINLAVASSGGKNQAISTQVSLRNRKTNL